MPYNDKADWKKYLISNKRNEMIRNLIKKYDVTISYGKINELNNFFCGTSIGFKHGYQEYYIDANNRIFNTLDKVNVTELFKNK